MAFTVSAITNTVVGNLRMVVCNITTDAAEGTAVIPGLSRIVSHDNHRVSGTASLSTCTILENVGTTGTAAAGQLAYSAAVNAAVYRVHVYGF